MQCLHTYTGMGAAASSSDHEDWDLCIADLPEKQSGIAAEILDLKHSIAGLQHKLAILEAWNSALQQGADMCSKLKEKGEPT